MDANIIESLLTPKQGLVNDSLRPTLTPPNCILAEVYLIRVIANKDTAVGVQDLIVSSVEL